MKSRPSQVQQSMGAEPSHGAPHPPVPLGLWHRPVQPLPGEHARVAPLCHPAGEAGEGAALQAFILFVHAVLLASCTPAWRAQPPLLQASMQKCSRHDAVPALAAWQGPAQRHTYVASVSRQYCQSLLPRLIALPRSRFCRNSSLERRM